MGKARREILDGPFALCPGSEGALPPLRLRRSPPGYLWKAERGAVRALPGCQQNTKLRIETEAMSIDSFMKISLSLSEAAPAMVSAGR